MSNCDECKNFLDTNVINDRTSYLKWLRTNHPDKFRRFGDTDPRYINATADSMKATSCFPMWYGEGAEKVCPRPSRPTPPPRASTPPRPSGPTPPPGHQLLLVQVDPHLLQGQQDLLDQWGLDQQRLDQHL